MPGGKTLVSSGVTPGGLSRCTSRSLDPRQRLSAVENALASTHACAEPANAVRRAYEAGVSFVML